MSSNSTGIRCMNHPCRSYYVHRRIQPLRHSLSDLVVHTRSQDASGCLISELREHDLSHYAKKLPCSVSLFPVRLAGRSGSIVVDN
jgi:hypothetical protein